MSDSGRLMLACVRLFFPLMLACVRLWSLDACLCPASAVDAISDSGRLMLACVRLLPLMLACVRLWSFDACLCPAFAVDASLCPTLVVGCLPVFVFVVVVVVVAVAVAAVVVMLGGDCGSCFCSCSFFSCCFDVVRVFVAVDSWLFWATVRGFAKSFHHGFLYSRLRYISTNLFETLFCCSNYNASSDHMNSQLCFPYWAGCYKYGVV